MNMISLKTPWQTALIEAVTDPQELFSLLGLDLGLLDGAYAAAKLFPLKVPHSFVARMQRKNLNDPLLRQVLPINAECSTLDGFVSDPLQEALSNPVPGLLHKYRGRVLLMPTAVCGIHCRYCFRREFAYEKNNPGTSGWQAAIDYIANDASIIEVILSGGDPLAANDSLLKNLLEKIAAISHVKRLRIHSRLPIVLPERITPELIHALTDTRLRIILTVHCNHAQEIDTTVVSAMQMLTRAGIILLNQSVLLKGVNDDANTLVELSEALFAAGIQPYYLHLLDKVSGAAHFDLTVEQARELHWQMAQQLSGYLVPKLVYEAAHAPAKLTVTPQLSQ